MDGITATHATHVVKILLYAEKQSHYTAAFFFFFLANFTNWQQKKPSATSRKEFKKRTSRTFAIFL
jgi:hypothetical protein